ncbi:P-loop NTPase fold protein [Sphingomonas sp. KR3-1]|uniref:KAP family P-loop NTPase fold protein n=1 Tax=Sphingomonas sp. KR3-1 TaxID=3156611 RepID=UPI0032B494EC
MPDEENANFDRIWAGDLFDRRNEAAQLEAYIESLVGRPILREDKHAFTIAVDAGYGEGKTFFLRRLADQLALNHPVAFVDAWADDLADEPLTALAATLKTALAPFVTGPEVASRLSTFMKKTGKVARIASMGLARRALSIAITGAAVDGIDHTLAGTREAVQDAVNDGIADVVDGLMDDTTGAIRDVTSHALMEQRVSEFEEGRAAVQAMKDSLKKIVEALDGTDHLPPIIIIIDELDRCRPNYAVKLLEEIKHLFDVPGLVFILGMHGQQLAHSVNGAYGSTFDGRAYLRRFIDRELTLAQPNLYTLVQYLYSKASIKDLNFVVPPLVKAGEGHIQVTIPALIGAYMTTYGLAARDAFQLVDILQTSIALANQTRLHLAYLLPLAIGHMLGLPRGQLPEVVRPTQLRYAKTQARFGQDPVECSFNDVASDFEQAAALSNAALNQAYNDEASWGLRAIYNTRNWHDAPLPLWDVARYPDLIATVGRFRNPSLS